MRMFVAGVCVVVSCLGVLTPTVAQPPAEKKPLRTVHFEFRDQPWDKVLEWYARESGLAWVGTYKPTGTFSFSGNKDYTIPEVTDYLNESLLLSKHILIRKGQQQFMVAPADAPQAIDETMLPLIIVDDLEIGKPTDQQKLGRTELAQIIFPLHNMAPEVAQTNVKALLGPFGKVAVITANNKLLVTDMAGNLRRAKTLLDEIDPAAGQGNFEVISLGTLDGESALRTVRAFFNYKDDGTRPASAPSIDRDPNRNMLIVRGSTSQIQEIKNLVHKLEHPSGDAAAANEASADRVRYITLERKGSTSAVIDALTGLWPYLRNNPIEVVTQSQLMPRLDASRKQLAPPATPPKPPGAPKPMAQNSIAMDDNLRTIAAQPDQLSDPRQAQRKEQRALPGSKDRPVFIAPMNKGDGIIVGSDDPEALTLVDEMVRYLMQSGDGEYTVLPVHNANATEVATTLDQLFNGAQQQQQRGGRGAFNPFAMMMGQGMMGGRNPMGDFGAPQGGAPASGAPATTSTGVVRIVADTRTNSLLVRAPRLELTIIKRLLENYLDVADSDAASIMRTYIIGPLKNANATDIAQVLRDVYKDYINPNAGSGGGMVFTPFGPRANFGGNNNNGQPQKTATLTIGVDDVSNMIIVSCPEQLFMQIKHLADDLDSQAANTKKVVRVYRVSNMDPAVLQQAVGAFTGRRPSTGSGQFGSGQFGGGQMTDEQRQQMRDMFRQRMFGTPGGGANPQGGGPPGGGPGTFQRGPQGGGPTGGGTNFFVDRVKDDPRLKTVLYDPQKDPKNITLEAPPQEDGEVIPIQTFVPPLPQQPRAGQAEMPRAPRRVPTIEVLPDGQVVIIGDPADVEEMIKVLEALARSAVTAETNIQLFPLKHGDANVIANELTQFFRSVIVNASSTTRPTGNQQLQTSSVVIIPIARLNSLLIGAPQGRMKDIEKSIRDLDQPLKGDLTFKPFKLEHANAARVAQAITQFYATRYALEAGQQSEVRVQAEEKTNSVLVQASPTDLEEVTRLIKYIDSSVPAAVNEVRIVPLKYAYASDLALLLTQAIADSIAPPAPATTTSGGALPTGGQQAFGQQQQFGQQPLGGQQAFGQQQQAGARPGTTGTTTGAGTIGNTSVVLKLISQQPGIRGESGFLENVRLTADIRTNSIIVSSPATSTDLILALIHELDVPPTAQARVKVFQLKKADASATAAILQQLFLGTSAGAGTTGRPAGTTGLPGTTGFPTTGFPGTTGLAGQGGAMTFAETTTEGLSLISLRTAVDVRTNSVIVAASTGDLILVEAIIGRLDSTDIRERKNEVYKLRNSTAADVATALTTFYGNEINVLSVGELTPFTQIERQVVVVPEAVSNTLLISADPRQYEKVIKIIEGIDAEPPQVVIQVLIGQVTLNDTDEFGVQLGVQTPILFQRSIIPANGFFGSGTVSYANPAVPSGVTVSNSLNATATQGFNWLNTNPLGNNPVVGPSVLGSNGLTDLGVGVTSSTAGIGGFVFRAASDSVNVLIRALKSQGRIDVLSRPQITALDNQVAYIQVGQTVPYITNSTVGVSGQIINTVQQQPVGVILQVTPRINKDGQTIMRVEPQISSLSTSTVNLGNNTFAPIFNITQASTTVIAQDGQTIAIGGLLTKSEDKEERKVPWLGDLPYLGSLFRYRTYNLTKTELLILLTPHVVRTKADAERILAEETRKMDWCLEDVIGMHGPIFGEPAAPNGVEPLGTPFMNLPGPNVDEPLHSPRPLTPPEMSPPSAPAPGAPPSAPAKPSLLPPSSGSRPILQQGPWR